MAELSSAEYGGGPPRIAVPRNYNAAHDLIARNLQAGRGHKVAFIDDNTSCTYAQLDQRSNAFANVLRTLGLGIEQRILLCLHDTIDFPTAFLGAIKAGVVPVAVNTLLTQGDYEYMLGDSRARVAVVSAALLPLFQNLLGRLPFLERILVSGGDARAEDALAR
jgi:benzoate-CoA ligase